MTASFSFLTDNCVAAGAFTTASFCLSGNGSCVEVGSIAVDGIDQHGRGEQHLVLVRDTKQVRRVGAGLVERGLRTVPTQVFTLQQWHALHKAVKNGQLNAALFGAVQSLDDLDELDLAKMEYTVQLDLGGASLTIELMQ